MTNLNLQRTCDAFRSRAQQMIVGFEICQMSRTTFRNKALHKRERAVEWCRLCDAGTTDSFAVFAALDRLSLSSHSERRMVSNTLLKRKRECGAEPGSCRAPKRQPPSASLRFVWKNLTTSL